MQDYFKAFQKYLLHNIYKNILNIYTSKNTEM